MAGAKVVLLGVSYLENADDTRNTPTAALAKLLLACGAEVTAHDPYVRKADWARVLGNGRDVPLTADLDVALRGADCAALVTCHREYAEMRTPVVDGRNMLRPDEYAAAGIAARTVGKG